MFYPTSITELINSLTKLPGIGPKNAERLAFHIIEKMPLDDVQKFSESLKDVKSGLKTCNVCGFISDDERCYICQSKLRKQSIIMVVEQNKDLIAIEKTKQYDGVYHILGSAISPMNGIGPDDIKIDELIERVKTGAIEEVILATNPSVEGEATALFISKMLEGYDIKVTKLAHGLPIGGELGFVDEMTLLRSLEGRNKV